MNTAAVLEALIPDWRATLPPTIDRAYFDAFVARNRKQLEATLAPLVALLDAPTPKQRRQIADEEARMGVELSGILEHVDRIQALDLEGVPPTTHVISLQNVTREDVPRPSLPVDEALREAADVVEDRFAVVKFDS